MSETTPGSGKPLECDCSDERHVQPEIPGEEARCA